MGRGSARRKTAGWGEREREREGDEEKGSERD